MQSYNEQTSARPIQGTSAADIDAGLRSHMVRVYNYMMMAVGLSGAIAFFAAQWAMSNPAVAQTLFQSPLKWVIMFAPLGVVFLISFRINSMSFGMAQMWYWIYAGLVGLSISAIFLVYTGESIFRVFLIASVMFGATSLYGYTTKADLTKFGSFLIMGVFGLIIASVVNMIWPSDGLGFAISVLGVLIFTGLTAYETQQIKSNYVMGDADETAGKKAIIGALGLYISFLNIFLFLLQLLGDRE